MDFPENQISELKRIAPDLTQAEEGGHTYIRIKQLPLPEGCNPSSCDVLLCPNPRDNYISRLFFSTRITGCPERNWNFTGRILSENWYAFSWNVPGNLRLAETLLVHLKALRK